MTDRTNPASLKSRPSLLGRLRWILAAQLVALAVVLGAPMPLGLPAQVAVAATTSDGIVYEQREPGTVAITGYEGAGGRVEIPAQLEGLPVTSVADGAFSLNTSITEVSIPEGVLSVGNETFNDCVKLSSVELPASLSSIGDGAFYGCASLASIAVPGTVADWGDYVFSSCERLESVRIGEGVDRVPTRSFIGDSLLSSVELPSSVKLIEKNAFRSCGSLATCDLSHVGRLKHGPLLARLVQVQALDHMLR